MTDEWNMEIVYNTLIPYTWYAGVVEKLQKTISDTTYATKGDIVVASAAEMPVALPIGTDGQVLTVQNDGSVAWEDPTYGSGDVSSVSGTAPIVVTGTTTPNVSLADAGVTLAKMADLAQDTIIGRSTASTGVPEAIVCTAFGRALLDDTSASVQRTTLGLGTMATETATNYIPKSLLTAKGSVITSSAAGTPVELAVGTDGKVLTAQADGTAAWEAAGAGTVMDVSGSAPIVSTGGSTPAISISAATTGAAGSMSAADKTKLDSISFGITKVLSASAAIVTDADASIWNTHFLSNGVCYISGDFDHATTQYLYWQFELPDWNGGTVTFQPVWLSRASGSGTVKFKIAGINVPSGGDFNVALAALQTLTDTFGAANRRQVVTAGSAVTMTGTGYGFCVSVCRDWATDTFSGTVDCLALLVNYTGSL